MFTCECSPKTPFVKFFDISLEGLLAVSLSYNNSRDSKTLKHQVLFLQP